MPLLLRVAGEVSEREDLLGGQMRVALDGASSEVGAVVSIVLGWRRGRDGATALHAGDCALSIEDDAGGELHAAGRSGSVAIDPDTAEASVHATFVVEEASGGLAVLAPPGAALALECAIGAEAWSGELLAG